MKTRNFILFSLIVMLFGIFQVTSAVAAGSKPRISVNCGQLTGNVDSNGTYALFKPTVTVAYFGLPLTVTSYYYATPTTPKSETGRLITTFTGKAPSSKLTVSNVNIEQKILEFSQPQTGYYRFEIEAVDTLKRKSTFVCTYEDYHFSMPIIRNSNSGGFSSGTSGSSSSLRGFNKSACTFNGKKLYGSFYVTSSPGLADFSVYISSSSGLADLNVYLTNSSGLAWSCGNWYKTSSPGLADFSIYLTNSSGLSDFSIYLTSSSGLAGTW